MGQAYCNQKASYTSSACVCGLCAPTSSSLVFLSLRLARGEWCKFGRVVKALALGASLARGMGSNPIACNRSLFGMGDISLGGVAHSVERSVRNRQAQGSKPCSSTPTFGREEHCCAKRQWCIGNIEASQALAPGSTPGWRIFLFALRCSTPYITMQDAPANLGGVAQMVERLLCMQEAQGSIPCSSTLFCRAVVLERTRTAVQTNC